MTLEDAFAKMIKKYFEGNLPEELDKSSEKKRKYTKRYFDNVGRQYDIEPYKREK